jgi:ribonuclease HI
MADYSLIFDGGSLGNPGQGYGSYQLSRTADGKQKIKRLEFGNGVTNNEAEYRSLIAGLEDLQRMIKAAGRPVKDYSVAVAGDSKLVIEQVAGRWKVKEPRLQPLRERAAALLKGFAAASTISWHPRQKSVRVLGH